MTDLIEFIRAQLGEDERVALDAGGRRWRREAISCVVDATDNGLIVYGEGTPTPEQADHIALHDPASELRKVEACRRILDEHSPIEQRGLWHERTQTYDTEIVCQTCVYTGDDEDTGGNRFRFREHAGWPCGTALLLALPYADRPGYREEWRP